MSGLEDRDGVGAGAGGRTVGPGASTARNVRLIDPACHCPAHRCDWRVVPEPLIADRPVSATADDWPPSSRRADPEFASTSAASQYGK